MCELRITIPSVDADTYLAVEVDGRTAHAKIKDFRDAVDRLHEMFELRKPSKLCNVTVTYWGHCDELLVHDGPLVERLVR